MTKKRKIVKIARVRAVHAYKLMDDFELDRNTIVTWETDHDVFHLTDDMVLIKQRSGGPYDAARHHYYLGVTGDESTAELTVSKVCSLKRCLRWLPVVEV